MKLLFLLALIVLTGCSTIEIQDKTLECQVLGFSIPQWEAPNQLKPLDFVEQRCYLEGAEVLITCNRDTTKDEKTMWYTCTVT